MYLFRAIFEISTNYFPKQHHLFLVREREIVWFYAWAAV